MKQSSILVDTNVLVALLDKKDLLHGEALSALERVTGPLSILDVILGETYSVLVKRSLERGFDPGVAIKALRSLESTLTVIDVRLSEIHGEVVDGLLEDASLNYNDWVLLLTAKRYGMVLLTLDKRLKSRFHSSETS